MAAPFLAAAAPRAVRSSPSATKEPSATPPADRATNALTKSSRLRKRAEFLRVYDQGLRLGNPLFSVFYLKREESKAPRVGFTVPRALGNSVKRNRIRRRMREAVRLELNEMKAPVDMVFHPRQAVYDAPMEELRRQVKRAFAKCSNF